jgi:hypothetical protein
MVVAAFLAGMAIGVLAVLGLAAGFAGDGGER